MIDLHTHLLPEIDDGASSTEEAFAIMQRLYEQKIETAVCTPHFDASKSQLSEFLTQREISLSRLKNSPVHLLTGSETALNEWLFHYSDLSSLCIEDTRYLLLELPYYGSWGEELYLQIAQVVNYYSVFPIIAHIERYEAVSKNKKTIRKLIQMGCVIQMNAGAVLYHKGARKALGLIKKGYVDILASDCHNMANRPPNLSEAYDKIRTQLGNEYCLRMEKNSKQILEGKKLRGSFYYLI